MRKRRTCESKSDSGYEVWLADGWLLAAVESVATLFTDANDEVTLPLKPCPCETSSGKWVEIQQEFTNESNVYIAVTCCGNCFITDEFDWFCE